MARILNHGESFDPALDRFLTEWTSEDGCFWRVNVTPLLSLTNLKAALEEYYDISVIEKR